MSVEGAQFNATYFIRTYRVPTIITRLGFRGRKFRLKFFDLFRLVTTGTCLSSRLHSRIISRQSLSRQNETHLFLQFRILILDVNELEDDVERAGETKGEEQGEASQVRIALGASSWLSIQIWLLEGHETATH